jgi:putative transposase
VVECANGILKHKFGLGNAQLGFSQAEELVQRAVEAYNELRPHISCDFLTPSQAL